MAKPCIVVYGATAFCARPIIELLVAHPDRSSFSLVLSGRSPDKLAALAAQFDSPPVHAASTTDQMAIDALVGSCSLVINCAGPFRRSGAEALIRACAEQGKHYLDLCGEGTWLSREIIPVYHDLAAKTGACIVPCCGVDSVPSDMMVYLASKALQKESPQATVRKALSIWRLDGGFPGGTIQSLIDLGEYGRLLRSQKKGKADKPKKYGSGEWAMTPLSGQTSRTKLSLTLDHPDPAVKRSTGAFFLMWPLNRCVVRRSWYLYREAAGSPATSDSNEPVMGPELLYEEAMTFGMGRLGSSLLSLVMFTLLGLFVQFRWFQRAVARFLPQSGQGPSVELQQSGFTNISNLTTTSDPSVQVSIEYRGKGDPGCLHTAYLITGAALSLLLPSPFGTQLPPLGRQGGCLTPMTACGQVLVERLQESGGATVNVRLLKSSPASRTRANDPHAH